MEETEHVYHQSGALKRALKAKSKGKCFFGELPPLWVHSHVLSDRSEAAIGQQDQPLERGSGFKEENENKLGYAMYLYVYPSMCLS